MPTKEPAAGLRGVRGVDDMADALDKFGDRGGADGEEGSEEGGAKGMGSSWMWIRRAEANYSVFSC